MLIVYCILINTKNSLLIKTASNGEIAKTPIMLQSHYYTITFDSSSKTLQSLIHQKSQKAQYSISLLSTNGDIPDINHTYSICMARRNQESPVMSVFNSKTSEGVTR